MVGELSRSRMVVGVDGSSASDAAVRWAAQEARMRALPINLINVVAPSVLSSTMAPNHTTTQGQDDRAREVLDRARQTVAELAGEHPPDVHAEMAYAAVVPTLVEASKGAHMIVVGSRGADAFRRGPLGSVGSGLLHEAHCPVAVIHDSESAEHQIADNAPVLVGIDGSRASEAATALAFDEAARRGVPLVALHAWSDVGVFPVLGMDWRVYRDEGDEVLGERLAGWHERYPDIVVHRRVVCDVPARWLVDESKNAQLVVLGRHGRGRYPGMRLGSVSSAVARSAHVPVIVVRSGT
jgi:nucleotide-binding universal stress UspA family protein